MSNPKNCTAWSSGSVWEFPTDDQRVKLGCYVNRLRSWNDPRNTPCHDRISSVLSRSHPSNTGNLAILTPGRHLGIHLLERFLRLQAQDTRQPVTSETAITKLSPPFYPLVALQARITGTVELNVTVRRDGSIESVAIVSGHPLLRTLQ